MTRFVTETVCERLDELSRVDAIRAIHEAHPQLSSMSRMCDLAPFDPNPTLEALAACLRAAGHPGYLPC